jgi:hypothetical protein
MSAHGGLLAGLIQSNAPSHFIRKSVHKPLTMKALEPSGGFFMKLGTNCMPLEKNHVCTFKFHIAINIIIAEIPEVSDRWKPVIILHLYFIKKI